MFDLKDRHKYNVIGIDEAQFFDYPTFAADVDILSIEHTVIACGLNCTSERTPFRPILDLIPLCDKLDMLTAVCTCCGSDLGAFSYYKAGIKNSNVLVGGKDEYTSLCRVCHSDMTRRKTNDTIDGYQPRA